MNEAYEVAGQDADFDECVFSISMPNGVNAEISVPVKVLKHILVTYGGEKVIPAWLVHFLLVAAQAEDA